MKTVFCIAKAACVYYVHDMAFPQNGIRTCPQWAVLVAEINCLFVVTEIVVRLPGTYFTHEAKGADDAADADTAIINAEGGHNNSDEKKEYYI